MWVSIFLPPLRRAGCWRRGRRRRCRCRRPGRRRERGRRGPTAAPPRLPAGPPLLLPARPSGASFLPPFPPPRGRSGLTSRPGRAPRSRPRAAAAPRPAASRARPRRCCARRRGPGRALGLRTASCCLCLPSAVQTAQPRAARTRPPRGGNSEAVARRSSPAWVGRVRLTAARGGTRCSHRGQRVRTSGVCWPRCALRVLSAGSPAQWYAPAPPELAEPFPWQPGSALGRGHLTPSAPGRPAAAPHHAAPTRAGEPTSAPSISTLPLRPRSPAHSIVICLLYFPPAPLTISPHPLPQSGGHPTIPFSRY